MHSLRILASLPAKLLFLGALALGAGHVVAAESAATAPTKPTIFVLGDSTARNGAKGKNGEICYGWGTPLADYFDANKVEIANVAHAGTSSRSYFNNPGDWPAALAKMKAGDYVLLVFGINDGAAPPAGRGSLPGTGDETVEVKRPDGSVEIAHTYGWYMATMATLAKEKGAKVTLLTVTTRDIWNNPNGLEFRAGVPNKPVPADHDFKLDRIERGTGNGKYTQWTKDVGAKLGLPVIDLTNFCADKYEALGREKVDTFYSDHNHTYLAGADFVAATIVSGLKGFKNSPYVSLLSEKGKAVVAADKKYLSAHAVAE